MRSASILEYLLERYQTDVFCFAQPGDTGTSRHAGGWPCGNPESRTRKWTTTELPVHRGGTFPRAWRNLRRALVGVAPLVDRFSGHEHALREAVAGERYDVAVVEHFWCAPYAPVLRPHCSKLVLDLHNVESLWHTRAAEFASPPVALIQRRFASVSRRLERLLLPDFDHLLVTSQQECKFLPPSLQASRVHVVPNTVPFVPLPTVAREDAIVFSGNMEYLPNAMALRYFAKEIWPLVTKRHPKTRWKIVGKGAHRFRNLAETDSRVVLVSNPTDAMMEIARASVAVVPLLLGTGTRLKIIEAWAAGVPVVSTALGAEGLEFEPEEDICVRDGAAEFSLAISSLLDDGALAERIGTAGRRRYELAYTWARAWDTLSEIGL